MATFKERQPGFGAGELSPALWGRTDSARYQQGAKLLENFIITPYGTAVARPGTVYGGTTSGNVKPLLVPFVFSAEDAVMLVFANLKIQFYTLVDGIPTQVKSGGVAVEVVSPYADADLALLRWSQVGDVLYLFHPAYSMRTLTRVTPNTSWSLATASFSYTAFPTVDGTPCIYRPSLSDPDDTHPSKEWVYQVTRVIQDSTGKVFETLPYTVVQCVETTGISQWAVGTTYALNDKVVYGNGDVYVSLFASNTGNQPDRVREKTWWQRKSVGDLTATQTTTTAPTFFPLYPDRPVLLTWGSTSVPTLYRILATRVYRGRVGRFGFLGETRDDHFADDGSTPDFERCPPQGTTVFEVKAPAGTVIRTEEPATGCFHQGRLVVGGTVERPFVLMMSAVEDYLNFDVRSPPADSSALTLELASLQLEKIRAVLPSHDLVVLTQNGEWIVGGGDTDLLTPATLAARQIGRVGAAPVAPALLGNTIFYVARGGSYPRAIVAQDGKYQLVDVGIFSRHLFDNHQITQLAVTTNPWPVLWAVRDDGVLLSCTWSPDTDVMAWSRQKMGGYAAAVTAVASIPDGGEDKLFVSVSRDAAQTIEVFSQTLGTPPMRYAAPGMALYDGGPSFMPSSGAPAVPYAEDLMTHLRLDCAVRLDRRTVWANSVNDANSWCTLDVLNDPGSVMCSVYDDGTLTNLEGSINFITLNFPNGSISAQYNSYASNVLDCTFVAQTGTVTVGDPLISIDSQLQGATITVPLALYSTQVTKVDLSVSALVVTANAGTAGATITSSDEASFCAIGIPYTCTLETLDTAPEKGRTKIVNRVTLEYAGYRNGTLYDTHGSSTVPWTDANAESVIGSAITSVFVPFDAPATKSDPITGRWQEYGSIGLTQSVLPLVVTALQREYTLGE